MNNDFLDKLDIMLKYNKDILLLGETGVGKSYFAKKLHDRFNKNGDFIILNCSAIPRELIEAELFGHEPGAFTGATEKRIGKIEAAKNGVLFLDEIGEVSIEIQKKLLNVLGDREYTPLGATKSKQVQCQIMFATNRDLEESIKLNNIRKDFYNRIKLNVVKIPSLEERKEEIPRLLNTFINESKVDLSIESIYLDYFKSKHYPGNIRQLKNEFETFLMFYLENNEIQKKEKQNTTTEFKRMLSACYQADCFKKRDFENLYKTIKRLQLEMIFDSDVSLTYESKVSLVGVHMGFYCMDPKKSEKKAKNFLSRTKDVLLKYPIEKYKIMFDISLTEEESQTLKEELTESVFNLFVTKNSLKPDWKKILNKCKKYQLLSEKKSQKIEMCFHKFVTKQYDVQKEFLECFSMNSSFEFFNRCCEYSWDEIAMILEKQKIEFCEDYVQNRKKFKFSYQERKNIHNYILREKV